MIDLFKGQGASIYRKEIANISMMDLYCTLMKESIDTINLTTVLGGIFLSDISFQHQHHHHQSPHRRICTVIIRLQDLISIWGLKRPLRPYASSPCFAMLPIHKHGPQKAIINIQMPMHWGEYLIDNTSHEQVKRTKYIYMRYTPSSSFVSSQPVQLEGLAEIIPITVKMRMKFLVLSFLALQV